ncbi:DUF3297 family protein [Sphingomonas sabuli]|uniref:DUF3297 family protein n=1 Tax=Sphingomonas sabuli TaxID=2764186 RepID=A0A7G9L015_9SPHN|nr:DUF3297 family protein [Sphingomonas sabuli]QNM81964.1 DUF3297 family protein [Sphingomonas sabuli]
MADEPSKLPDRLSLDPRSPHFDADLLQQGIGIKFNGQEKTNVQEYCISEGWIKVPAGRSRDRFGNPMTLKLNGKVEPYIETAEAGGDQAEGGETDASEASEG